MSAADDPEAPPPPAYPIESVDNALRVLLMFREQSPLRGSDVARLLDVAPSTAHRLLAMLQYRGFITQDESTRSYVVGGAMTDIGLAAVRKFDARLMARPVLESIAHDLGETVHLGVLEGADVLYIDAIEGTRAVRVGSRVGLRMPAHASSAGRALLAHSSDKVIAGVVPAWQGEALARALAEEKQRNHFLDDGESEDEICTVAVPVLSPMGHPIVAISVAIPRWRFDDAAIERSVSLLHEGATQMMSRL